MVDKLERAEDIALNMQKRFGEMPTDALVAYNRACRDIAEHLATLPTPTEDARERVKLLEEVKDAFNDALTDYGAQGYGRDTPAQYRMTSVLSELRTKVLTALGNKETDRHG